MYKAIKPIGDYKVGDTVPEELAKLWLEMFSVPQVEKVSEAEIKPITAEPKPNLEVKKKEETNSFLRILDDYISRNQGVVKKNIEEDKLSNTQLEVLLKLEKDGKKRPLIINTIKKMLSNQ